MANINNLERQHRDIYEALKEIKALITKGNVQENSSEIAKMINLLAGKLKIHLQSEDKFLYPALLESDNMKLKELAKEYISDMGTIHSEFEKYKLQFNTKNKIDSNIEEFKKQTEQVFKVLENRLSKEDIKLYPLMKEESK